MHPENLKGPPAIPGPPWPGCSPAPHLPASSALCSPHPLDRLRGDERLILPLDTSLPFSLDTPRQLPGKALALPGHIQVLCVP